MYVKHLVRGNYLINVDLLSDKYVYHRSAKYDVPSMEARGERKRKEGMVSAF